MAQNNRGGSLTVQFPEDPVDGAGATGAGHLDVEHVHLSGENASVKTISEKLNAKTPAESRYSPETFLLVWPRGSSRCSSSTDDGLCFLLSMRTWKVGGASMYA